MSAGQEVDASAGSSAFWPPRSPNLTPLNFFLWGFVKNVYIPLVPVTLNNLKDRIQKLQKLNSFYCKIFGTNNILMCAGQQMEHIMN
jgi:hypothetical protein